MKNLIKLNLLDYDQKFIEFLGYLVMNHGHEIEQYFIEANRSTPYKPTVIAADLSDERARAITTNYFGKTLPPPPAEDKTQVFIFDYSTEDAEEFLAKITLKDLKLVGNPAAHFRLVVLTASHAMIVPYPIPNDNRYAAAKEYLKAQLLAAESVRDGLWTREEHDFFLDYSERAINQKNGGSREEAREFWRLIRKLHHG